MALRLLFLLLILSGCNPIIGATSFMHSLVTGNTVGTITGGAGIAIENATGKSVTEHVWESIKPSPKYDEEKKVWVFDVDKLQQ